MAVTAADVKKLRDQTGAGMMDAKKALTQAEGDFERAIELLRVAGAAKAAKRSDRQASNGLVAVAGNSMIQFGSETDFVAKNAEFVNLAEKIVAAVDEAKVSTAEQAKALKLGDKTVEQAIEELAAKIGEKLELAKVASFSGKAHNYLHKRSADLPPQVGVLVEYEGDNEDFIHSIALQIASMRPDYVDIKDVPESVVEREKRIAEETAKEEGKPENIIPKIVEGRVNAFYKEACLMQQASITDDKKSIGQLADKAGVKVLNFVRFVVGE